LKKALITGASTGIGLACAQYLAEREIFVFAGVRSDKDFERLSKLHKNLKPIKIDISSEDSIQEALKIIKSEINLEDDEFTLFNNAGIVRAGPLEFVPIDELKLQLDVNVTDHVRVCQIFLPMLRKLKDSRILFTGSQSGFFVSPLMGPYCASKHAIEAIADAFRQELAITSQIKVVLIQPGQIKTPIWNKSLDKAHEIQEKYPEAANKNYGHVIHKIEARAQDAATNGAHTDVVAKDVFHAITAHKPKARYRQGKGATISYLLRRYLSDYTLDKLIRKALKI